MELKNFIVLGAGVSGLTLSYELLKAGQSVKILESLETVGGLARTDTYNGMPLDSGPHLFHSAHEDIINYWRSLVGDNLVEKSFHAGNFQEGKIFDYPVNKETFSLQYSDNEISLIESQLSEVDAEKLASATNYSEYVEALAGEFLANKFFKSYPEKLWGLSTNNLSAKFAPRRIEIRDTRRPFHSGPGRFAGIIEGGCGSLAFSLADRVKELGGEILLKSTVKDLSLSNRNGVSSINSIILENQKKINAEGSIIISTLPITKNAAFLDIKTNLYFRSIFMVNIIFNGEESFPKDYDWLYFDDLKTPFHRIGLQTRFSRKNIPDGYHILSCEIVYQGSLSKSNVDYYKSSSVKALVNHGFLKEENICDIVLNDLGPVYPGYYTGHENDLASVTTKLGRYQNFYYLGSLAEYAYSDLQVLTAKAIDMAKELSTANDNIVSELLRPVSVPRPLTKITFDNASIGLDPNLPVFLIAEIGLSHNGNVDICKKLIEAAHIAGFNAVKIQTYSEGRISKKSRTSKYYEESLDQEESISDFVDKIIFSDQELLQLKKYAEGLEIIFFSTPFDIKSFEQLESVGCGGYKISSMDLVNLPLIRRIAEAQKPIILSTGMANLADIEAAVMTCLEKGNNNIIVLHCVSSYPCDLEFSNLQRIMRIKNTFGVIPGFSDHTSEVETPALAVAMGARIIEKHITLDKGMDGPDQHFSLDPNQFEHMVNLVRKTEKAIRSHPIDVSPGELEAKQNLRRSIYSSTEIKAGEVITTENISLKSPGDGLPAKYFDLLLGRRIICGIDGDTPLTWEHFLSS